MSPWITARLHPVSLNNEFYSLAWHLRNEPTCCPSPPPPTSDIAPAGCKSCWRLLVGMRRMIARLNLQHIQMDNLLSKELRKYALLTTLIYDDNEAWAVRAISAWNRCAARAQLKYDQRTTCISHIWTLLVVGNCLRLNLPNGRRPEDGDDDDDDDEYIFERMKFHKTHLYIFSYIRYDMLQA